MSPQFINFVSWVALAVFVYLSINIPLGIMAWLRYPNSFQKSIDILNGIKRTWNFKKSLFFWACCLAWLLAYKF